ncbi:DNA methyltransferase [Thiosulfatihalobacter marinus]|uniref:DNA methyltransferase n=1 Tax=Thiosulfatihalobacter marinus TaxID=2792481 RepID=UPI0018D5C8D7
MTKLSDAQALILSAAAQRPEHIALPLPESLRGGAAAKVVGAMLAKGFLEEVGPPLRFGQMPEHDHRRLGQPELRGGDKPFHTVINGENFHVLEALTYTHRGKIDAIYIDPPYNTGARDWKYNNDYVEAEDLYRHSKWLAFIERRLLISRELLNPNESTLIVTIDEKEYLRLGLLLEQMFPDASIQMVSSVINPKGSSRTGRFSRVDEYIYFVFLGSASVAPWRSDMLREVEGEGRKVRWAGLMRNGEGSRRQRIPSMFFPIYIDAETGEYHSTGEPPPPEVRPEDVPSPPGTLPIWPIDQNGQELMWRLSPPSLRDYLAIGHAKFGRRDKRTGLRSVSYLQAGIRQMLKSGEVVSVGKDPEGALELEFADAFGTRSPVTIWNLVAHKTHLTQLLGRMVRTPLARRIPGNERLNSVDCLLPFFDEASVKDVAKALMSGGDGGDDLPGRRVLINPVELKPNPAIPEAVWDKLLSLPSQSLPKRHARPVKRLTSLAHELAVDGLLEDAGKAAHAEMHKVLDGARARYKAEIETARKSVLTVEGKSLKADLKGGGMSFDDFLEEADYAVIEDAYRRAGRAISPDLATSYSDYLARSEGDADDMEAALIDAHVTIGALGLVPGIRETLEAEAEKLANQWLTRFRVDIKNLSDERQDVYRQIREMSANPMDVDLARPTSWMQPTTIREANGSETPLPSFERHMLCDEHGMFPEDFNSWEGEVVKSELARAGAIAWYRNPSRASQDSLGIIYEDGGEPKIVRPDFVFFVQQDDGTAVADIVDPHGIQFGDAMPKLKGLAQYAERFGDQYRRIEAVAKIGDKFRVLDLKEAATRASVSTATTIKALYESANAFDYLP